MAVLRELVCSRCGTRYDGDHRSLYCSPPCRDDAVRESKRDWRRRNYVPRPRDDDGKVLPAVDFAQLQEPKPRFTDGVSRDDPGADEKRPAVAFDRPLPTDDDDPRRTDHLGRSIAQPRSRDRWR